MSIKVMTWVWTLELPHVQKLLLLGLADCANDEGVCWPRVETLAVKCCVERKTVLRNLRSLADAGLLEVEQRTDQISGRKLSNRYRINAPEPQYPRGTRAAALVPLSPEPSPSESRALEVLEPSLEPSENPPPSSEGVPPESNGVDPEALVHPSGQSHQLMDVKRDHAQDPGWLAILHEIPTWPCAKDGRVVCRIEELAISQADALMAATSLAGKWNGHKYKHADMTFVNWALSEQKRNGKPEGHVSPNRAGELGAFADVDRYRKLADEQEANGDSMPAVR